MQCPDCRAENPNDAEACFTCGRALFVLTQGTVLAGRYTILQPLGKGGMGRVYRARDRVMEEDVAVKVLRAEFAADPEMSQRFVSEIRLARRIGHRNVCRIHEYGEHGDLRFIAMELIDGVTLKDLLARGQPLPPDAAYEVGIQVARGLHAVHEYGIIHRDFKASNILIDRRGTAKLADFGIAKDLAEDFTGGANFAFHVMGTPEYMSPEQVQGHSVDVRSDVYSLGCVVYEMFTGYAPFRGETVAATVFKHVHDPFPFGDEEAVRVAPALEAVLRRALAKLPAARYATVAEFIEAFAVVRTSGGHDEGGLEALVAEVAAAYDLRPAGVWPAWLPSPETPVSARTPAPDTPVATDTRTVARPQATAPAARRAFMRRRIPAWAAVFIAAAVVVAVIDAVTRVPSPPDQARVPAPARTAAPAGASAAPRASPTETSPVPEASRPPRVARAVAAPEVRVSPPVPESIAPSVGGTSAGTAAPPTVAPSPLAGLLRLLVVPESPVSVDGQPLGPVSARELSLGAGTHVVRIEHPDYQPLQRKVTVRLGETTSLVIDLAEKGVRRSP